MSEAAAPKSEPRLETPEEIVERLFHVPSLTWHIEADREQIAAWCEAKAGEAEKEARGHSDAFSSMAVGGASAYRAIAALLRGAA